MKRHRSRIRSESRRPVRSGFTLIELLVVIAVIAILMALLIPAVQKVREAAARTQCQNNLKQWGIAMHSYHSQRGKLPMSSRAVPNRVTWVPYIWPFIEQDTLFKAYNFGVGFWLPPNTQNNSIASPVATMVPLYYCPSDRPGAYWKDDIYWRCRGNYVVSWGPITRTQISAVRGVFGAVNGDPNQPYETKFRQISDGLSNTVLMSEVLQSKNDTSTSGYDARGDFQNDDVNFAGYMFMAVNTPNSSSPDQNLCQPLNNDKFANCTYTSTNGQQAARSRHNGGVNAVLCDGSVRWVANDISQTIWQSVNTINGGESTNFVD